MWFKRNPKNRRLAREFVLDVKLRSSQVRAARMRMAMLVMGVVLAVLLGVYLTLRGGEWALDRLVYENKALSIEQIEVTTDGVLAVSHLRRWSGVQLGDNLLALDMNKIRRNLSLVSVVQSVAVERVLPHKLRIRVMERDPVAQLELARPRPGGGLEMATFYLDSEGYLLVPVDPLFCAKQPPPPDQLPLITGPNGNEIQAGRRLESPQVQAALQLVMAFDHSPMSGRVDLKRIDASALDALVVTTGQGSEVTFGLVDLEAHLRRWAEIHETAQRAGKAIATLDLAVSNSIPVRLAEAGPVAPVTPKIPKPYRKKHV